MPKKNTQTDNEKELVESSDNNIINTDSNNLNEEKNKDNDSNLENKDTNSNQNIQEEKKDADTNTSSNSKDNQNIEVEPKETNVIKEQKNEIKNNEVVSNNEPKVQKKVVKEKLSFKGCLSEFAVTAHKTSLEDLLSRNYILSKHGNIISKVQKENLLNNKKINSNTLIVIGADNKPHKVYYDKENGSLSDKPLDDTLAFQDKQAFKWYKLIVAAFYFIAKLIQAFVNLLKYPLRLDEKSCLNRALKSAFRKDTRKKEETKKEVQKEVKLNKEKQKEKVEIKENDKKLQKDDLKEKIDLEKNNNDLNINNELEKENSSKDKENTQEINNDLSYDKKSNLEDVNIDNSNDKLDDLNVKEEIVDPILALEADIYSGEDVDFDDIKIDFNIHLDQVNQEIHQYDNELVLDNNLLQNNIQEHDVDKSNNQNVLNNDIKNELSPELQEKIDNLDPNQKEFVNHEMQNNNIKDIEVIHNDVIIKVEGTDQTKNQLLIQSIKETENVNEIENSTNLVLNLEKNNETNLENNK